VARHNRIDPASTGPSPKAFIRLPQVLKDEIEQAAREERREISDYYRVLLDEAMALRAQRLGRTRRSIFDRAELLERTA